MRGRTAVILALGASAGLIVAYLLAGGASYEPLEVADPCEPRSDVILEERGTLEGITLSALDGAACELQVTREELTAALGGDARTLARFAERYGIDEQRIDEATRAALVRAVDDADREGRLPGPTAEIARFLAERAPIAATLDAFRAIPGDPTPADLLGLISDLNLRLEEARDLLVPDILEDLLDGI